MNEQQFNTFVNEKYSNPDGIHHYEITQESGDTKQKIEVYDPDLLINIVRHRCIYFCNCNHK